ncbi:hypothetical protein [Neobacillus ginsengisoli]|uniref:Fur-regulated basic protein FbpA n=1 Tax=Neobacillus ginsengisoli TaxID=904295 RepID=A0ABT9XN49_9BACI|nr:hypothetical protein [Neobacillus ginsengisoli]MDQ0196946.1 hypothetical protein [Neobacillus ginsengisoli]
MSTTPRIQRKILQYSVLFKMLGIISDQEFKSITNYDFVHHRR